MRTGRRRLAMVAALAVVCAGCAGDGIPGAGVSDDGVGVAGEGDLGGTGPGIPLPADQRVPWSLVVPDGTPIRAYRPVPAIDRTATIELVEELRVTEREGGPQALFGARTPRLDVDDDGFVYVADASNQRVSVFDRSGAPVRTLGRDGGGPGEFQQPMDAVVAGGALFVSDTARGRLSKWTLSGELLWDRQLDVFPGYLIAPHVRLPDGGWLIRFHVANTADEVIARLDAEGAFVAGSSAAAIEAPLATHSLITRPERVWYPPRPAGASRAGQYAFFAGRTPPAFAFAPSGRAFVSPYEEYQVLALDSDGEPAWALQVPWPREPLADAEKQWGAALMRSQGYPDAAADEFAWPDATFALGDLKVDGAGRLFVFPYTARGAPHERIPVDVYSPDGELVFAGWLQLRRDGRLEPISTILWPGDWKFGPMIDAAWQVAVGDEVYGVVEGDGGEWVLTRHRLRWPGSG